MKRALICFLVIALAGVNACGEQERKEPLEKVEKSPLSQLMREMQTYAGTIRSGLLAGDTAIPTFQGRWPELKSAEASDPSVKTPFYYEMADLFIQTAGDLAASSNKKEAFNNLVNACISCHQAYCPGPVKGIRKLKI